MFLSVHARAAQQGYVELSGETMTFKYGEPPQEERTSIIMILTIHHHNIIQLTMVGMIVVER